MILISTILAAAGAAVGLFLAMLLFSTGSKSEWRANRWLAILMLAIALVSIQDMLDIIANLSDHYIQRSQPELVVAAVQEVIAQIGVAESQQHGATQP